MYHKPPFLPELRGRGSDCEEETTVTLRSGSNTKSRAHCCCHPMNQRQAQGLPPGQDRTLVDCWNTYREAVNQRPDIRRTPPPCPPGRRHQDRLFTCSSYETTTESPCC